MSPRICHADADADMDADTNGICTGTGTNMSPLTCGGGHQKFVKQKCFEQLGPDGEGTSKAKAFLCNSIN